MLPFMQIYEMQVENEIHTLQLFVSYDFSLLPEAAALKKFVLLC